MKGTTPSRDAVGSTAAPQGASRGLQQAKQSAGRTSAPASTPARSAELDRERLALIAEGIDDLQADLLTRDSPTASLYRGTVAAGADSTLAANWIVNELPRVRGERALDALPFGPQDLGGLLRMVASKQITTTAAREVLGQLAESGGDPAAIVAARGLRQLDDESALRAIVDEIISDNPAKVDQYRNGRTGLLGFFMGQAMQKTGGRASAEVVQRLLLDRLT